MNNCRMRNFIHTGNYKVWGFVLISFICLFLCTGCTKGLNSQELEAGTERETIIERTFAITEETSIEDDFEYFGLEVKSGYDTLALTKLYSMINDGTTFYLYLNMPKDTANAEYRIKSIVMNEITYAPKLVQMDEYYQKYVLYHCAVAPDQKYEITEIAYYNNLDLTDRYTHYQKQIGYMGTEENAYRFRLEYENTIVLQGKLFECIYQFNKENGTFQDLWYKVTDNFEKLDEDKRSFFYFAFNCYDKEREIPFTPEDILEVDVEYNELHYSYQGKEKSGIYEIDPEVAEREEAITPDEVTVTAKESKRSNGFYYQYQTINRLAEADLDQNVSNEKNAVLQLAANDYDWAISFGRREGYRYAMNDTWFSHDYEYTEIEEFRTIRVTYTLEGHTYTVNTDSLIGEKVITLPESVPENQKNESSKILKWVIGILGAVIFLTILKIGIQMGLKIRKRKKRGKAFFKKKIWGKEKVDKKHLNEEHLDKEKVDKK